MQGNAAVIELSRTDLRRWHYVGKLTPAQIQERYLQEHGVYAHHQALADWLRASAQLPERLENDNESIHQHACGEYILEQLQKGSFLRETDWPPDTRNRHGSHVYRDSVTQKTGAVYEIRVIQIRSQSDSVTAKKRSCIRNKSDSVPQNKSELYTKLE